MHGPDGLDPEYVERLARANRDKEPLSPAAEGWQVLFTLAALGIFWLLYEHGPSFLDWAGRVVENKTHLRLVYISLVLVGSAAMYRFRRIRQSYYGLTECAFAIITGWRAAEVHGESSPRDWLALLAAAYLFVRGLVNYYDGKKVPPNLQTVASAARFAKADASPQL